MQEVIQAFLTAFAGWNVRVANSTLERVQQAILSQSEVIIVEVSVGEIDGLRFLKQLRTPPATQGERLLLNTVHQWRVYFDINSPFLEATDTLCKDFCKKI
jgi:CheY-like chemotaxis protein